MFKSIIAHLILFFYIYSVPFKGVPLGTGTRVLLGLLGLVLFFSLLPQKIKQLKIEKKYLLLVCILILLALISLLSIAMNQTDDLEFVKYPISILIILLASYFVIYILQACYYKLTLEKLSELIINVIFIQIILSLLMFVIPDIQELLITIQYIPEISNNVLSDSLEFRLIGFGIMFFGAGVINGFALILIAFLIKTTRMSIGKILYLAMAFFFILVLGMMMARTTLIGAIIAITVLLIPRGFKLNINSIKNILIFITSLFVIPLIVIIITVTLNPKVIETFQPAFNFGFELFINYLNNGVVQSASTSQMQDMYVFPNSFKTYIIGDAYYSNPNGYGYYMDTDIGYLRLIYYFGMTGLVTYLYLQFIPMRQVMIKNKHYRMLCYSIFIYLLILNLKGFTDFLFLSLLFMMNSRNYHTSYRSEMEVGREALVH